MKRMGLRVGEGEKEEENEENKGRTAVSDDVYILRKDARETNNVNCNPIERDNGNRKRPQYLHGKKRFSLGDNWAIEGSNVDARWPGHTRARSHLRCGGVR